MLTTPELASSALSSTQALGNNTQQSIPRIDQGVLSLAKECMFRNDDMKISQKVYAYGELITDFSATLRGVAGLSGGSAAVHPMGIAGGANMVLGGIYFHNGNENRKDADKVGNKKERRNSILLMVKGAALVVFGAISATFRSLSMVGGNNPSPKIENATAISGQIFGYAGLALFLISLTLTLVKIANIMALKLKMIAATFGAKNKDFAQFAVISKKLHAMPSEKSIDLEVERFNKLTAEEKLKFKAELSKWLENAETSASDDSPVADDVAAWKDKLTNAVSDDELRPLYVAVRIGTRKQQKLMAHFGGNAEALAEATEVSEEVLTALNERATGLGFKDFYDLMHHAKKNTDATKHEAAVKFITNESNYLDLIEKMKGVLKTTHSALNQSMIQKLWGVAIYGLGSLLWILGMIFATGAAVLAINVLWIVIGVTTIYLDGKDLWDARNHEMVDRKERIAMLALNVIALLAGVLALVLTVGSGGLAPILFAGALAVCYIGLAGFAYWKRNSGYLPLSDANKTKVD